MSIFNFWIKRSVLFANFKIKILISKILLETLLLKKHSTIFWYLLRFCPYTRPKFVYMEICTMWPFNYFVEYNLGMSFQYSIKYPANTTSQQRLCHVTTWQRRCNDVVRTLCVCWVMVCWVYSFESKAILMNARNIHFHDEIRRYQEIFIFLSYQKTFLGTQ